MINGIVAVPVMVVMMRLAVRRDVMGALVISRRLACMGWLSIAAMATAAGALLISLP